MEVPIQATPTVAPQATPVPTQSVNPTGAFGFQALGEGAQSLANAAQSVSDMQTKHALTLQTILNQATADTAFGEVTAKMDKLAGDYRANNLGANAIVGRDDIIKQIGDLRDGYAQQMNPMAKELFDQASRRTMAYAISGIDQHVATETKKAIVESHQGLVSNAAADAIVSYGVDDGKFQDAMSRGRQGIAQLHNDLGMPPEQAETELRKFNGKVYGDVIEGDISGGKFQNAINTFEEHKGEMDPDSLGRAERILKPAAQAFQVGHIVDGIFSGGVKYSDAAFDLAIAHNEGSAYSTVNKQSGALGRWQLLPTTAQSLGATVNGHAFDPANASDVQALLADPAQQDALHQKYKDQGKALFGENPTALAAAQIAGNAKVQEWVGKFGLPEAGHEQEWIAKLPAQYTQTKAYVQKAIGQMGSVGGPTIQFHPGDDPASFYSAGLTTIQKQVEALEQTNPILAKSVESEARTKLSIMHEAAVQDQRSSMDRIDQALSNSTSGQRIVNQSQLMSAYPGAAQDVANLPPNARANLPHTIAHYYDMVTAEQQQNADQIKGKIFDNPYQATSIDLNQYNLSPRDRQKLTTDIGKAKQNADEITNNVRQWTSLPIVSGITKGMDEDTKSQFFGALAGEVERQTQANGGKKLDDTHLTAIASQVSQKQLYNIPDNDKAQIVDYYQRKFHYTPSDYEVGEFARRYQK